jgi:peptide/nickel transport system permease protein
MSAFGNAVAPDTGELTAPEVVAGESPIAGRTLRQLAWRRLKKDRVAMVGGVVVILTIVLAALAGPICHLLGVDPTSFNSNLIDPNTSLPYGHLSGISWHHLLGVEPTNGRDLLARTLYGAQVSLTIAILATALSMVIGVTAGIVAGFRGGFADTLISRSMDVMLAFPVLLFSIAILSLFQGVNSAFGLNGTTLRLVMLVFIIGFFSWAYIGRVIRGQVISLREKEFIDAARSIGAKDRRILVRELLPNLAGPMLVYATLTIPTNILYEAALSYLGVGVQPPTSSWGGTLSNAVDSGIFAVDPWYMFVPGMAIFITVLAYNLFGDGLRDALDPKSSR